LPHPVDEMVYIGWSSV